MVEFVSANPTGPLHVGHGRHAAFGATLLLLADDIARGAFAFEIPIGILTSGGDASGMNAALFSRTRSKPSSRAWACSTS